MFIVIFGIIIILIFFVIIISLLIYNSVTLNLYYKKTEDILDRLPFLNKKFDVNNIYSVKKKGKTLSLYFTGKDGDNKGYVNINFDGKSEGFGKNKWKYNKATNTIDIKWSKIIKDIFEVYNIKVNSEFIFNDKQDLLIYFSYKNVPKKVCLNLKLD